MLRSFRLCIGTLLITEELFWSQPPVAQQRLLNFTAGPLGVIANLLPGDKQHLDNFLLLIIWYPFIKNDIYKESYDT